MATQEQTSTVIPTGTWTVVPAESKLGFRARGMFGLAPVKGTFGSFDGELTADELDVNGELRIAAASLDTGNAKRDNHLRSEDFFHADAHPTVSFRLLGVSPGRDEGHELTGELRIRQSVLQVSAPVTVVRDGDSLTLTTELAVDRAAAGVGWSKLGMIKGPAHLSATVTLAR
jgi:polyisoprenoid-binding protein YceI